MESAIKDSNSYKREKHELDIQISQLKKEMEKVHISLIKHAGQINEPDREISESPIDRLDGIKNVNSEDGLVTKARSFSENENGESRLDVDDYLQQGAMPKESKISIDEEEKQLIQKLKSCRTEDAEDDHEYLSQKVKMLQLRLDDAQKILNSEKE